ncbi:MAG: Insulinase (Peptidase M16) [Thelocarpon impressellum]|nr:MAG: Insulinase (Peptidase M16) [Thelocarpon impressellum]
MAAPKAQRIADKLETPLLDDRSYRVICLPNKLEVLLVHELDTDKASVALDVNVGSFSDPDDMPGMAHAFPEENDFRQFLTLHSGDYNAYTDWTSTNYHLELAASPATAAPAGESEMSPGDSAGVRAEESPLYGALDRFAQFFIAPLFLASTLDRELKAVDSENKKNLQSDTWRQTQLSMSLSNPKHPYCHFSTGNLETLHDKPLERGIEIRSEFIKFYERHYSANRMKMAVLGRESLDELESWVVELFSAVRNKDLPQNRWDDEQPLTKNELLTQYVSKPVMDIRELEIVFPFLDEEDLYESPPGRYLSHLIGHEGPGSILSCIKSKGWANGLYAGPGPICPGAAFFTITIFLTDEGLKQCQEIVKVVFQYISLLQETPPQAWIVEEMKGIAEVDFRFRQKTAASGFTSWVSAVMQRPVPREWLLSASSLIRKFDPESITNALTHLRPDNFRMAIVSQALSEGLDRKERWYGTEYRCEPIPEDFLAELRRGGSRLPDLYLPSKNEFIPTKLDVERKEVKEPLKAPRIIRNDESARIWWKKDDRFWVPKGNICLTLRSPLVYATAETAVKTRLYCELVKDALVEYSYDADIAGLYYGLGYHADGLDVEVEGYNDKMPVLLEKVVLCMRDLEVKPDRFKVVKERLLREYRNWDFQQPYQQVQEHARLLSVEKSWANDQRLAELVHVVEEDIRQFYPQLLRQVHIEAIAHGNLYRDDALGLTQLVESILKPRALPQSLWIIHRGLILPSGSDYLYQTTLKDAADVNNCVGYYLFVGGWADRMLRAKTFLFAQTTDEPVFDQLRTKEQLGYMIWSGLHTQSTRIGYYVLVQSEKKPEVLEARIDAFLDDFGARLEQMSNEELETHKRSLVNAWQAKLKNLGQETNRFRNHICSNYLDFEQVESDVACLNAVSKADLAEFYEEHIRPGSQGRAKLSVHALAQSKAAAVAVPKEVDSAKIETVIPDGETVVHTVPSPVDALADPAKAEPIISDGETVGNTALPSVDVTQQPGEPNGDVPGKVVKVIQNAHEFRASLAATAGALPVRPLSDFEDFGTQGSAETNGA